MCVCVFSIICGFLQYVSVICVCLFQEVDAFVLCLYLHTVYVCVHMYGV